MRVKQRQEELQGATEEVPAYSALGSRQKKKNGVGKDADFWGMEMHGRKSSCRESRWRGSVSLKS
jgi:hypothetical protein